MLEWWTLAVVAVVLPPSPSRQLIDVECANRPTPKIIHHSCFPSQVVVLFRFSVCFQFISFLSHRLFFFCFCFDLRVAVTCETAADWREGRGYLLEPRLPSLSMQNVSSHLNVLLCVFKRGAAAAVASQEEGEIDPLPVPSWLPFQLINFFSNAKRRGRELERQQTRSYLAPRRFSSEYWMSLKKKEKEEEE